MPYRYLHIVPENELGIYLQIDLGLDRRIDLGIDLQNASIRSRDRTSIP